MSSENSVGDLDGKTTGKAAANGASGISSLLPSQAELVRAYRMDELWIGRMAAHIDCLAQVVLGGARHAAWRSGLSALGRAASKALYYGATTSQCLQTLGEEYVNVIQVDRSRRRIPGPRIRLALLVLQCLFPDLLLWLLRLAERRTRSDPTLSEPVRQRRLALLGKLGALVTATYEFNSALFYINGAYYQLSKRLLGVQHLRTRPGLGHVTEALYKLIGWLSLAKLAAGAVAQIRAASAALTQSAAEVATPAAALTSHGADCQHRLRRLCPLCCDRVQEASVISACGHVFCWACIVHCLQVTGRCPLCRIECPPQRVIHLAEYSDAPL